MIRSSKELVCIENLGTGFNNGPSIPLGTPTRTVFGAIGNNKGYTALSDEEIATVSKHNEDAILDSSFEPAFYYRIQFIGDFSLDNVCYGILRPCRCVADKNQYWSLKTARFASLSSITRLINRLKSDNLVSIKVFRVSLEGACTLISDRIDADSLVSFLQADRDNYDGSIEEFKIANSNDYSVEFYKGKILQLTALLDEKDQKIEQLQNQNNSLKERLLNLSCILKEASEICNPVNL